MSNVLVNFRRIAIFLGVFVVIFLVVEFNARLEELHRLNNQRDETRVLATQAAQTLLALQTQAAYAESTAAVEKWARTEGHYAKEGEQPVVPVGQPGSAPVIVAPPPPTPTPLKNWEIWWKLFFDK
jgi:hypothetical protein